MPDELTVHVNRSELYSLALPDAFETGESFDVRLVNHGQSTHVHLHIDDSLSQIAALEATNHHLDADSERRVRVTLTCDGTARGNLKVVTGYGQTTRLADVTITETQVAAEPVEVGEDLTKPKPREEPSLTDRLADSPYALPVAGSAVVVLVALGAAAIFQNALILVAAVLLAVGGLAAAVLTR